MKSSTNFFCNQMRTVELNSECLHEKVSIVYVFEAVVVADYFPLKKIQVQVLSQIKRRCEH